MPLGRAALEAIAFQVADVLDAMRQDAGIRISSLRVDGGAAVNNTLMQFQADILGVPITPRGCMALARPVAGRGVFRRMVCAGSGSNSGCSSVGW